MTIILVFFSSLYYYLIAVNEHVEKRAVLSQLLSYLSCDIVSSMNRRNFSVIFLQIVLELRDNNISVTSKFNWIIKGYLLFFLISITMPHQSNFKIQLVMSMTHNVSITGSYIYDSNHKRSLLLMIVFLYIIFFPSKDEKGLYAEFKDVFYAVKYENPLAKSGKDV